MKKLHVNLLLALAVCLILALFGFLATISAYPVQYRKQAALYHGDWRLVLSVIKAESNFNERATSAKGACGLMQILPDTAEFIAKKNQIEGYDLYDGQDNIRLGCLYLQYLEGRFCNLKTVLAAYNAGEGTVSAWLKNEQYSLDGVTLIEIPYSETERYVKKIIKYYENYKRIYLTNGEK